MSILEVKNVSIRYMTGDFKDIGLKEYIIRRIKHNYQIQEFWADKDITFSLEKGDMLGIIGTNGAGKSTLLKAISGIMEPTKGQVKRSGTIAALLELASGFDGDLTVRENTYLRGAMLGYTRKFMDETYDQIIEFAELADFQDRPFKQLSSGMKSRLAFSIASLVQPDILILDEVLSVGDGAFRQKSEAKMREIMASGATTILVSHSVRQVRELCNKVLWLDKGEQVAFGETQILCNLYQQCLNQRTTLAQAKKTWGLLHKKYDYLVVGAGLYGAVFAREATDHGKRCLVIDRRFHLGGLLHDEEIEGIRVHKYGAHVVHTDNKDVWDYLCRYVTMLPYEHHAAIRSGTGLYDLPIRQRSEAETLPDTQTGEDQAIATMGSEFYQTMVKDRMEKLWGRPCDLPPPSPLELPVRSDGDGRYFTEAYQGIPEGGYDLLIEKLLEGSDTITGLGYQTLSAAFPDIAERIICTGRVDQFFEFCLGKLEYRSLQTETEIQDVPDLQGRAVIEESDKEVPYLRVTEHKHITGQGNTEDKTVITRESFVEWVFGREPVIPVRDPRNIELHQQYLEFAKDTPHVVFCGCLGGFALRNMDQVITSARELARKELE